MVFRGDLDPKRLTEPYSKARYIGWLAWPLLLAVAVVGQVAWPGGEDWGFRKAVV